MTIQDISKENADIKQTVAQLDERINAHNLRLDAVEKELKENRRVLVAVERLASATENIKERVGNLDVKMDRFGCRIETIEQKPAKRWDALVGQVISITVAATCGYLLSSLIK